MYTYARSVLITRSGTSGDGLLKLTNSTGRLYVTQLTTVLGEISRSEIEVPADSVDRYVNVEV